MLVRLEVRERSLLMRGDLGVKLLLTLAVRLRVFLDGLALPLSPAQAAPWDVLHDCVAAASNNRLCSKDAELVQMVPTRADGAGFPLLWLSDLNDPSHPCVWRTRGRLSVRLPTAF